MSISSPAHLPDPRKLANQRKLTALETIPPLPVEAPSSSPLRFIHSSPGPNVVSFEHLFVCPQKNLLKASSSLAIPCCLPSFSKANSTVFSIQVSSDIANAIICHQKFTQLNPGTTALYSSAIQSLLCFAKILSSLGSKESYGPGLPLMPGALLMDAYTAI